MRCCNIIYYYIFYLTFDRRYIRLRIEAVSQELTANYEVEYLEEARREAKKLLKNDKQYLFCVQQAKLLRYFPERTGKVQGGFFCLDIRRIDEYWELRIWDKVLGHLNVRIMFAVFSQPRKIVALSVYAKKTQATPLTVKGRCRHRIRKLCQQGYRL